MLQAVAAHAVSSPHHHHHHHHQQQQQQAALQAMARSMDPAFMSATQQLQAQAHAHEQAQAQAAIEQQQRSLYLNEEYLRYAAANNKQ